MRRITIYVFGVVWNTISLGASNDRVAVGDGGRNG